MVDRSIGPDQTRDGRGRTEMFQDYQGDKKKWVVQQSTTPFLGRKSVVVASERQRYGRQERDGKSARELGEVTWF